ncbi:dTMP kinase [Dictyoglomus thermophilum]|uniref:Thymidylate kinase n=1 Tax=Dictyoglomus thermophilum (strain ATCC 35947 / DSM 3960 / H-6-12) TaxID=309799 RepID=B5YD95_DICT6|nr:dTMP kinase [Dictyoglomus thermophilum]ACI19026.1 thymidylate kinase [Dictyoglomus thermophilum H-6-12]
MKNSLFITFEGIDGSGKTTQAILLKDYLESKGFKVYLTREPGGTEVGSKIREILLSPDFSINPWTEVFLYLASRVENTIVVKKKLEENYIVICERYADSTIAYQGYGRNLPLNILAEMNDIATSGLKPDLTVLIDLDPELALRRKKTFDRIEMEGKDFYYRVREGYLEIAKREQERFIIIPGSLSKEEIFERIVKRIKEKFLRGV